VAMSDKESHAMF